MTHLNNKSFVFPLELYLANRLTHNNIIITSKPKLNLPTKKGKVNAQQVQLPFLLIKE